MEKLEITGGARIGMVNATWPFATLIVTKDKLVLNASILGNFVFQPEDIISIDTYMMIPLLGQGIKINHRIANYNSKVIFWTIKDPSTVVNQIKQTGFLDNIDETISDADKLIIKQQQQAGGFPIKKSVAIAIVILWNVLLFSDFVRFSNSDMKGIPLGIGSTIAVTMLFLIALLTLISKDFSKLMLKEGKSVTDIKNFLYFIMFISGFMLIGILTF